LKFLKGVMLEKFKKAAKKMFDPSAEDDALQGLQDVLQQQAAENEKILETAKRTKATADEMARQGQRLREILNSSDNVGFLPGSAEDKLARVTEVLEQARREIFEKNGGAVSVETTEPFTAMRPLRFKSDITGVTV
jgi:hypothetical protein